MTRHLCSNHSRTPRPLARLSLAACTLVAGCAGAGELSTDLTDNAASGVAATAVTGLKISGNQLLRNGEPFRPRGFNMIGALSPAWCTNGSGVNARNHFTSAELSTAVNTWHANTIRLQVSQRGLGDSTRTAAEIDAYLQSIRDKVALARTFGLVIILSMQDQGIGCGSAHPLPFAQTVAAWRKLAPAFANDPDIIYELFNEPQNDHYAAAWAQWRNGGSGPITDNQGETPVGHQTLVSTIRGAGANNVLLADGGDKSEHLDNITPYLLTDTATGNGIGYAVHPYYFAPGQSYWESSYGYLASSQLIVATEWNYKADKCGTTSETLTPALFNWLEQKGIGVTGHAFDAVDTLVADWNFTPTQCGTAAGGSGQAFKTWLTHLAQRPNAPTGLSASTTNNAITATWSAPSGAFAIAGYELTLDGALGATSTTPSATLGGLQCNTSYVLGVAAYDVQGNHSPVTSQTVRTAGCFSVTNLNASPATLVTSTTIGFTLSAAATVNLNITSTSGTIVKHRLSNAALSAGANSVSYYGWGDNGKKLSPGSYLIQLDATDAAGHTAHAQTALQIQ